MTHTLFAALFPRVVTFTIFLEASAFFAFASCTLIFRQFQKFMILIIIGTFNTNAFCRARKACFKTFTIVFLTFSFGTFTFDGSLCFLGAYIIIGNGFRVR